MAPLQLVIFINQFRFIVIACDLNPQAPTYPTSDLAKLNLLPLPQQTLI